MSRLLSLLAASALALLGACAAPPPLAGPPQWIVMTPLSAAGDAQPPWLAHAATLVLRDELGAVPGLMVVIPPPAAASAPDFDEPTPWRLSGSVASAPDGGLSFDLALRRGADGSAAWQQRLDFAAGALWRRELSAAVARQIGVAPPASDVPGLGACHDGAAAAATLQAIEAFGGYRSRDDLLRVRALLEQALVAEPGCPEAKAHLAMTHVSEMLNRWSTDPAAQLALADRLSREAVAAGPAQPYARMARVEVLRQQGRVAEALEEARTMTRLDPSSGLFVGRLAALRYGTGDAAGTLEAALQVQRLPNGTLAVQQQGLLFEAMARYSLGEEAHAAEVLRKLLQMNPRNGLAWQLLAGIEAVQGNDAVATEALARFIALAPPGQSIRRLRAAETPVGDARFQQQRERYFAALRRIGLPE
ncbi:tetratricopeptide repeat protein [Piscinibacter sp.]|uniref:tetratricopeptide repeat protein n=1 Tax=Piscinibacter sp. TaxID=1903157 RepID=UPI0039E3B729